MKADGRRDSVVLPVLILLSGAKLTELHWGSAYVLCAGPCVLSLKSMKPLGPGRRLAQYTCETAWLHCRKEALTRCAPRIRRFCNKETRGTAP